MVEMALREVINWVMVGGRCIHGHNLAAHGGVGRFSD